MEAKKWGFILGIIFIMIAVPVMINPTLEWSRTHYGLLMELKTTIPSTLQDGWSPRKKTVKNSLIGVIGTNLTSCHKSMGRIGVPVYCCPPMNASDLTIVDFQFPDPSTSPSRVRRPTHLLDDKYIAKYKKALTIMKSLPYTDPRSFDRQANLHCLFCTGAYDQQNTGFPLNIHRSWLFFPWHRIMLHFHERILGSLIGDDEFALPFWPWDILEGMVMPEMYTNPPFFHKERDISHYPPSVVDLSFSCSSPDSDDYICLDKGLKPGDQISTNMALMYNHMVSGAKKAELFMGCPCKAGEEGSCDGPGTIEHAPHNTVHKWIGSDLYPGSREDMGVFYSAARDPIFYPHHGNIDRLWEVWRALQKGKQDIKDPDWLDSFFFFYDEKLQLNRIKISDVLDISKLRYAYENVDSPWLNSRPKPSVPPKVARHILKMRHSENPSQFRSNNIPSSDFRPYGRALVTSLTTRVIRPKVHRTEKEKEEEEEALVVQGIYVNEETYVRFDVYINIVNETLINPRFREFAGTFVHIPSGVIFRESNKDDQRKRINLKLGISELLEDLEADGDESVWVTLLPRSRSCINTTVDGLRIEYVR